MFLNGCISKDVSGLRILGVIFKSFIFAFWVMFKCFCMGYTYMFVYVFTGLINLCFSFSSICLLSLYFYVCFIVLDSI